MATTYIPAKKVAVTINYEAVRSNFDKWSRIALAEALEEMEARAKARAPVRDIFRHRGWARPPERVPRGIMRKKATGEIIGRKIRHHQERTRARFMRQVRAQSFNNREVRMPVFDSKGKRTGTERLRANPTSWKPLLRNADGYVTGDLREVDIHPLTGMARMREVDIITPGSRRIGSGTGEEYLSARGRQELRRVNEYIKNAPAKRREEFTRWMAGRTVEGRQAEYERSGVAPEKRRPRTALYLNKGGAMTLGGRLRGEIHRSEIEDDGQRIYGDVISPTEYAKYQEYGTSHNRAHPYMRPALYEMRIRFPQIVKKVVRRRY